MAANLAVGLNGKTAIILAEKPGWHLMGDIEPGPFATDRALEAIGYEVELRPVTVQGVGEWERQYAPVRKDTNQILGSRLLSSGYKVIQNRDFLEAIDTVFGEAGSRYETVGALGKGERVWALARMPEAFDVAQGDTIQPYLLASTSHDGTARLTIRPTTVRVVCQNTLTLALHNEAAWMVNIGHNGDPVRKLKEACEILAQAGREFANFKDAAESLKKKTLTQDELTSYIAKLLSDRGERGQKKASETILEILHSATCTVGGIEGTAWAAFNAVSEFLDHHGRASDDSSLFSSVTTGVKAAKKAEAFRAALALAS